MNLRDKTAYQYMKDGVSEDEIVRKTILRAKLIERKYLIDYTLRFISFWLGTMIVFDIILTYILQRKIIPYNVTHLSDIAVFSLSLGILMMMGAYKSATSIVMPAAAYGKVDGVIQEAMEAKSKLVQNYTLTAIGISFFIIFLALDYILDFIYIFL